MRKRSSKTEQLVYEFICSNPGKSTYEISKTLRMSGGRVRHALTKLSEKGLIRFKIVRSSYRIKRLSFPIEVWKLLPPRIRKQLKELKL